jgi:hypothetical protein
MQLNGRAQDGSLVATYNPAATVQDHQLTQVFDSYTQHGSVLLESNREVAKLFGAKLFYYSEQNTKTRANVYGKGKFPHWWIFSCLKPSARQQDPRMDHNGLGRLD